MSNTVTINNKTPNVATVIAVNIPPDKALNFGSLVTLFKSMTPQSSAPSSPTTNDIYLDDGTNTASATLGFRRYNGSSWVDFGLQSISDIFGLDDLSDVVITTVADGDRLVYDSGTSRWINQAEIDGGAWI